MLIPKVVNRIKQYLVFLDRGKYLSAANVNLEMMDTTKVFRTPPESGDWRSVTLPLSYGKEWTYYWFRGEIVLPDETAGKEVFLRIAPNADTLVYLDGRPAGAVNPFHDILRLSEKGKVGARYRLHMESYAGHKYPGMHPLMKPSVILTLGAHIDDYPNIFRHAEIVVKNPVVYALYYDARALFELAEELDDNSLRKNQILRELYTALRQIRFTASAPELEEQAAAASSALAPVLSAKNGVNTPEVLLVGHAHIDHAWLWPIVETERKAARTFANMTRYAAEFPEFVFVQSQPAQLDIVRREYPEVFASVRAAYERGQWEPNGGMWIEADCNLSGGESLIRQFLVGRQAVQEMLGYAGDTLWLPDVFGYAACLPQILAGCEIEYFVTSKINWNDTTRFPYDTFLWKGIDGSGVKTHYITSRGDGYNGKVHAHNLFDAWNQVQHKEVQSAVIKSIGEGDGGGGTMRADLESARRFADLEGAPKARWIGVSNALHRIFDGVKNLPEWRGELYLELHRGTYTTQARTKRFNRKLELELRECEFLYSLIGFVSQPGAGLPEYPRAELLECWKKLLTNQFHDIIPGSSIGRVYQDAERWYREIETTLARLNERARGVLAAALTARGVGAAGTPAASGSRAGAGGSPAAGSATADGSPAAAPLLPIVVFNSMSWDRRAHVVLPPNEIYATGARVVSTAGTEPVQLGRSIDDEPFAATNLEVPAMGAALFGIESGSVGVESPFKRSDRGLETPFYSVTFDSAGRIAVLYDKQAGREVVQEGQVLNLFQTAEDMPILWDAWDIDADWVMTAVNEDRLESSSVVSDGPLFFQIRSRYRIGEKSSILQDMIFYARDERVDFVTKIDWHESHRLLKVAFPVNVVSNQVRCEVQYGHVIRNTHMNLPSDRAQFEICAHKWISVEEAGYGAALMNDCKYGCDVDGSRMRLTLLRSPKAPDPDADMGVHYVTYSFLPFRGSFEDAGVVRAAYDLNKPLTSVLGNEISAGRGEEGSAAAGSERYSLLRVDNPHVVIEAVKIAEDVSVTPVKTVGAALVVRMYETSGGAQTFNLETKLPIAEAFETNMLERNPRPLQSKDRVVPLRLRPFEIKTVLLHFIR